MMSKSIQIQNPTAFFAQPKRLQFSRTCSLILFVVALLGSLRLRFTPGVLGSDTTTTGDGLPFPLVCPFTIEMMIVVKLYELGFNPNSTQTLSTCFIESIHTYDVLVFVFLLVLLLLLLLALVLFALLDRIRQGRQSHISNPVIATVVAVDSRKLLLPIDLSWCLAPHCRTGGAAVDALKLVRILSRGEDNRVAIQNVVGRCFSIRL